MKLPIMIALLLLFNSCNFFSAIGEKSEAKGHFSDGAFQRGFCYENYHQNDPLFYGTGTISDPYQIVSSWQILSLSQDSSLWSYNFVQVCDIDMGSTGTMMSPIGSIGLPFTGSYIGGYHVINGLQISASYDYVGLFGVTNGATIKSLALTNSSISAPSSNYVATLVGKAITSNINEILVQGAVDGGAFVGGIIGATDNGGAYNKFINHATISAAGNFVGGVVGYHGETVGAGNIFVAVNFGNINAPSSNDVGGIAGAVCYTSGISESVNYANIVGSSEVGGLVGGIGIGSSQSGILNNSITIGRIDGSNAAFTNATVGIAFGLAGSTSVSNIVWLDQAGDDMANYCLVDNSAADQSSTRCTVQNAETYYFDPNNAPMNAWTLTNWYFSGTQFPVPEFRSYFPF